MKVISILNQKGGVGKTTITYNLASLLALKGYTTLMVDSDCQCSLTLMAGMEPTTLSKSIVNAYEAKSFNGCIYKLPIDNLYILPSSLSLAKKEVQLTFELGRESIFKSMIEQIVDQFDFVLIDNPPSLGFITINNLIASDYLISPCEPTNLSVYAIDDLLGTVASIKKFNSKLDYLGIIINKFDKRIKIHNDILEELKSEFNIIGVIKNSIEAVKGIDEGKPCVINNPRSDVSKSFELILNNILQSI